MLAVKYVLITVLLLSGVSYFYAGMGIQIPELAFRDVASYGAPLGIALIALAVVLARFWQERHSSSVKG
jgi:hypothetical protein